MTHADIIRYRLQNHQISDHHFAAPAEVVSWLGAIQGQDYFGAKWSIGLRLPGSKDSDIEKAIAEKEIVRTWALRGTLHILAAQDIRWILKLLEQRVASLYKNNFLNLGLDKATLKKSRAILTNALRDGKQLTRKELMDLHRKKGISTHDIRASFLLLRAALDSHICFGERRGNEFTFALLDEWVPAAPVKDRDEALMDLIVRYFTSHGPATVRDFIWWSGLTVADVKKGIEIAGDHLKSVRGKDQTYWMAPELPDLKIKAGAVYLLAGFDEYIVAYKDRSIMLDDAHNKTVLGKNGLFSPTIIVNGRVAGTWKRTINKDKVVIGTTHFISLAEAKELAIARAAKKYGKFLGMPVSVE